MALIPPTEDGLGYCGYKENFAVDALHRRPDCFCKAGEMASWAPPAFWKAPPRELVLITGNGSKTWGYTGGTPKCHQVPMAPLDSFVQLNTTKDGEPILPEYAFALCLPGSWPFPSLMDKTFLPETYLSKGNPDEEEANVNNSAKKTRKQKGKKTPRRSKSARAASSASEISPVKVETNLRPARIVPSRSYKSYTFCPKGPIQMPWRTQVRPQRVPTWTIPGWALPFLQNSPALHLEHWAMTRLCVRVKIHRH